jgi:hypothetical protein
LSLRSSCLSLLSAGITYMCHHTLLKLTFFFHKLEFVDRNSYSIHVLVVIFPCRNVWSPCSWWARLLAKTPIECVYLFCLLIFCQNISFSLSSLTSFSSVHFPHEERTNTCPAPIMFKALHWSLPGEVVHQGTSYWTRRRGVPECIDHAMVRGQHLVWGVEFLLFMYLFMHACMYMFIIFISTRWFHHDNSTDAYSVLWTSSPLHPLVPSPFPFSSPADSPSLRE